MYKTNSEKVSKNIKVYVFAGLFLFLFVVYSSSLFHMQIVSGEDYNTQAKTISSSVSDLPAQRGEIYDRNATAPLVINSDSFAVQLTTAQIPAGRYDTVLLRLANYLGISKNDIESVKNYSKKSFTPIQIKSNVPFSVISNIAENKSDLPGVSWVSKPIRNYLHTESLCHVIGYVGIIGDVEKTILYNQGYNENSIIGKSGIEKEYDLLLQGKAGREITTIDVFGRVISDKPRIEPPVSGNNLVLSIDSRIQKLAEESLGNRVGSVVVLKPATGEILAMVSYPFYDSNIFTSQENFNKEYAKLNANENNPLINRAIQTEYPPASTFKIIMSTAMLQERAFPATKKIECTGEMEYGNRIFHCHLHSGHGWLDLKNGMAQSCDVYYWTIGRDYLGIDKIASYAKEFGFGKLTGIDIPNEKNGQVPTPDWKYEKFKEKWVGGDTLSASIGQGYVLATPLQMANMIGMVSNAGKIYKPHLLNEVRNPDTGEVIQKTEPEVIIQSTIEDAVWTQVQEALRYTVTNGTPVYPMHNKTVKIACKTGTAEVDGYKNSWHSWLVAYAPYDAPPEDRICVATVVEACNKWEWWAPYCTNIIIQGIFNNQTFDESITELGFKYLINSTTTAGRME